MNPGRPELQAHGLPVTAHTTLPFRQSQQKEVNIAASWTLGPPGSRSPPRPPQGAGEAGQDGRSRDPQDLCCRRQRQISCTAPPPHCQAPRKGLPWPPARSLADPGPLAPSPAAAHMGSNSCTGGVWLMSRGAGSAGFMEGQHWGTGRMFAGLRGNSRRQRQAEHGCRAGAQWPRGAEVRPQAGT